ncbi:heterokaryon incompatibility protein-domain-containing protein [Xylariales sp. AK1849]|nr:heterokaryon incompatibility protein-domain-containing protein [Xylariales sp. AK1849]
MASSFSYEALNPSRQEVRLLTLLPPGQGPSPARSTLVNCTLKHASLGDKPDYQALSYVWDHPDLTSPICVNGRIFPATLNHEAALRHIRQTEESLTLDQVQRMGDIYGSAREVIIWLGQAKQESSKLWTQLKELGEFAAKSPIELNMDHLVDVDGKETRAPWLLGLNLEFKKIFDEIRIGYSDDDTLFIEPLIHLLTRPWWSRIWVVQESSLALMARVIWGSNEMYWGILWAALGYLASWLHFQSIHLMGDESYHEAFFLLERSQSYWVPLVGAWERVNRRPDDRTTKLIDMLLQTSVSSASAATDPRNCVFGLLGLVDDAEELNIKVDYSQSMESVYEHVARLLLRMEGLKMLQCCQFSPRHRSGSLPTWVPDWSSSLRLLLDGLKILLPSGVYSTSGVISADDARRFEELKQRHPLLQEAGCSSSDSHPDKVLEFDESKPGILSISVARIDTILAVGYAWEEAGHVLDCHYRDMLWCEELERLADMSTGIYTEEFKQEALWRTPICDRGLPRLTYVWFPRATSEALGHSVLMQKFPLDALP